MEQDNEYTPHPDYFKGYNEGYMMTKYRPELVQSLIGKLGDSERSQGFKDGYEQYEIDKIPSRYPSWLDLVDHDKGGYESEKDKDDVEPEKE